MFLKFMTFKEKKFQIKQFLSLIKLMIFKLHRIKTTFCNFLARCVFE